MVRVPGGTRSRRASFAGVPGNAFQFGGIRLAPRASRPFRSEESLGIFFFVYGVGTDGSGESKLTAQYRFLLDGEEKAQTRPQPLLSGSARAMASDEIPLESFAPGEYQLLVTVKDEVTGSVVERRTTFRIEG